MKKRILVNILLIFILLGLFLINFDPHRGAEVPQHVDSWILISRAANTLDTGSLSSETYQDEHPYPPGSFLIASVVSPITGISLMHLQWFIPGIILTLLGMFNYLIAKRLFKKEIIALAAAAFSIIIPSGSSVQIIIPILSP